MGNILPIRQTSSNLADKFIEKFPTITDIEEGKRLLAAGPHNFLMKQYYDYYKEKIERD